jgi:hypothetical protein
MTLPIKKIPRYPIDYWLGRYEAWWLTMYGKKGFLATCKNLESFFGFFVGYTGLENFTIAEVTDFFTWRILNGSSWYRITYEMYAVRKFWNWLTEDKNLPLSNPIRRGLIQKIQRCNPTLKNPEPLSRTFAKVNIAPPNIRPPVGDFNYDTSSWDFGILQD